jgi:hemolysin III
LSIILENMNDYLYNEKNEFVESGYYCCASKGTAMHTLLASPRREQSQGEEIANSISHGIGLIAALVGAPFLIIHASGQGDPAFSVGTSIFAATIIFLYLSSTLYHALPPGKAKGVFRVIEHSAIFLLIAGSYSPFTLGRLYGPWGWTLFGIIWGLAVAGVVLKVMVKRFHPILSTGLYLLMGWVVVIAVKPLLAQVPTAGLFWLLAGGLSYTAGIVFFAIGSWLKFGHLIWHLFVIAGSICHYFTILWYAL